MQASNVKLELDTIEKAKEVRAGSSAASTSLSGLSSPGSIELLDEKEISPDLFSSALVDFVNMNDSHLNSVRFLDVEQSYPTDGDIVCRYAIANEGHLNEDKDQIMLLEIGWKMTSDAAIAVPCSKKAENGGSPQERKVTFPSGLVAEKANNEEFYQFCYVTEGENVLGASVPFRVFRPNENDFIEVQNRTNNDEDDFIVVRSEQALLQERLQQLVTNNGLLEYTKRSLEQKVASLERDLVLANAGKLELEHQLKTVLPESQRCMSELEESKMTMGQLSHELDVSRSKCDGFAKLAKNYELEIGKNIALITGTKNSLTDLESENAMLKSQLEDAKAFLDTLKSNEKAMKKELERVDGEKRKLEEERNLSKTSSVSLGVALEQIESKHKASAAEWSTKERELERKVEEMTQRLKKAAEEYEVKYKDCAKVENKLQRLQSKVEKYITKPKLVRASGHQEPEVDGILEQELAASQDETPKDNDVDILTLPCVMCKEEILCTAKDMRPMTNHLEDVHQQRLCPVCSQMFDASMANIDQYFHMHVENHFDNPESTFSRIGGSTAYLASADHSGFSANFP
ncbi:Calcium-binding and coiled-coil domain-containing protein 2 [Halotydeus destructor]|nr:Calcium-binding and coiled-coil domain-containing protein 2 [Halotydeus destructor]